MSGSVVILGCTAVGKSDVGEALAVRLNERLALEGPPRVMAVDSMQVYRGMDIGTAKPGKEVRKRIDYLMLDSADPWEVYSAARFAEEARGEMRNGERGMQKGVAESGTSEIENRKSKIKNPLVLVAGTILYLRALMEGLFEGPGADEMVRAQLHRRAEEIGTVALHEELAAIDPVAAARIHRNDLRRIVRALEVYRLTGTAISTLQTQWQAERAGADSRADGGPIYIGIRREKEALNRRINARVKGMVEAGLVEEVRRLAADPRGFSKEASSAVGYRQLLDHFAGRCTLAEAVEQIKIQTRHLAKMQRTWLKRWPASDSVHWIDVAEGEEAARVAEQALKIVEARMAGEEQHES